ncbi:MAG: hypothetical protein ACP5P4_00480 [Steroidobacteraceae bacterium]
MKLANTRATPTTQDRAAQLRRDQEAAPKLRTLFPMVEQLHFDLRFEGGGSSTPVPQSRILHPPARAHFTFPCPYSDCNGGFDLAANVDTAIASPSQRIEGVMECPGMRGGDSGSKVPCGLRLRFTLKAVCSPSH